jgi:hypothetical protein
MRQQTTTWGEVDSTLDYFLSDSDDPRVYGQLYRIASWNWSQRILVGHTPRSRETNLDLEAGGRAAVLPPDFLAVWRIYDSDQNRWWAPMRQPLPNSVRDNEAETNAYWVFGGKLRIERELTIDTTDIVLFYWAYWPEMVTELDDLGAIVVVDDEINVPPWAVLPLCHLTAANLLVPGAIQAARLRQWNIKVDSGTPLDNVRAQQAREHLFWWNTLLGMIAPRDWKVDTW